MSASASKVFLLYDVAGKVVGMFPSRAAGSRAFTAAVGEENLVAASDEVWRTRPRFTLVKCSVNPDGSVTERALVMSSFPYL